MIAKLSAGFGLIGWGFGVMVLDVAPGPGLLLPLGRIALAGCWLGTGGGAVSARAWGWRRANEQAANDSLLVARIRLKLWRSF